jgi:hypothetical protein
MHAYVARVQSVLQAGAPDNDILLYWPFDDVVEHSAGLMEHYGVHENKWLTEAPAGRMAGEALAGGLLVRFRFRRAVATPDRERRCDRGAGRPLPQHGGPATRRMSVETLERLRDLVKQGARVEFESLPQDVPGFGSLEARRAKLRALLEDPALRAGVGRRKSAFGLGAARAGVPGRTRAHPSRSPRRLRLLLRQPHGQGIRRLAAARYAGRIRDDPGSADRPHRSGGREAREKGKSAGLSTARVRRIHAGTHLASKSARKAQPWRYAKPACCGHRHCRASGVSSSSREGRCCRVPHA